MSSQYLKLLRIDQQFKNEIQQVIARRPVIPQYDPQLDNTRAIIHALAMQQGFDLALQLLMESK